MPGRGQAIWLCARRSSPRAHKHRPCAHDHGRSTNSIKGENYMKLCAQQHARENAQSSRFGQLARALVRSVGSVAIGASVLFASQAFASGTEQLKAFVAQVHSARGTFVQQEVRAPSKAQSASGTLSTTGTGKTGTASRT